VDPITETAPELDKTLALKHAFEPIIEPLKAVEQRIRDQARAFDPSVEGYVAYAIESHGKRLRPALALLSGGATGAVLSSHLNLAVVVELIHAATLVHDDILDHADKRRGQPTANARWGNSLAVLLGDCLFAHALKLATSFEDNRMSRRLSEAASEVCSGEMMQTQRRFDMQLSVNDYIRILEKKTGALFAVATELGGFLNGASQETQTELHHFGMRLGTAYQIYDDCLDLAGDEGKAGKTLGSDLRRGKLTLPILHLLQSSDPVENARLSKIILEGKSEDFANLVETAIEAGALRYAVTAGRRMLNEARAHLDGIPHSKFKESLNSLCVTLDSMIAPMAE
jgi:octaprenyl-diphosphate synthase